MPADTKLTIEINNRQPVELLDLTNSFTSFADEYRRFVQARDVITYADDVRLYVKEVRSGSIIVDLVALSPLALPFAEHAVTILDFSKYLKLAYDFLTGRTPQRPDIAKPNLVNLMRIVDPIARDNASQMNCSTIINGDVNLNITISSLEANAAQNVASRELKAMKEPSSGFHDQVVLYWYQARNDLAATTGDKATIESIFPYPVKTIFGVPDLKAKILRDPFSCGYLVDVQVETIGEKPALYKITEIHDKIDLPRQ